MGWSDIENKTNRTLIGKQIFTSSDIWSKPANLSFVIVEVQGGGGGAGGCDASAAGRASSGSGGSGGGYSRKKIPAADLGGTETVTVGSGGGGGAAGGNSGTAGGDSSFGSHCTGGGGVAGTWISDQSTPVSRFSRTGGTASGGDVNIPGGPSGPASRWDGSEANGGHGGSSVLGEGGHAQYVSNPPGIANGNDGTGYGGGGGGGVDSDSATGASGGDGTDGIVIVWEYLDAPTNDSVALSQIGTHQDVFMPVRLNRTGATELTLNMYRGRYVRNTITGDIVDLGSEEPTVDTTGLSSETFYYVYFDTSDGTLEVSDTASTTTYGVDHKTNDTNSLLVGWVYTDSSTQFVDSETQRLVSSLYNPIKKKIRDQMGGNEQNLTADDTFKTPSDQPVIEYIIRPDRSIDIVAIGVVRHDDGENYDTYMGISEDGGGLSTNARNGTGEGYRQLVYDSSRGAGSAAYGTSAIEFRGTSGGGSATFDIGFQTAIGGTVWV